MKTLAKTVDREETRQRLTALTSDDKAQWGVMSAGQMVCHVRGAFLTAMAEDAVVYAKGPLPPKLLKFVALRSPVKWPEGVPTLPSLMIGAPAMQTGAFAADHASLLEAFDRFCAFPNHARDHAFFHAMNHGDWMRWGYLHTDHHLRQFGR
jgi:hypothetical protein